ncbi:MAG: ethanolamine ammonia-lyase subunit EutB [Candidatus Obscuribacterales bacterium]|nr:ethanolamine ammonia-lyase subunit EutB [Candidatus Obscuribacterales bacterium]
MKFTAFAGNRSFTFSTLKEVLAKANEEKSGDILAGIAAETELERMAAKQVLSELNLATLFENPVVEYENDELTRLVADNLDQEAFQKIRTWSVAELREFLLSCRVGSEEINAIRGALSGEMVAAVCKIMSNMDLVLAAKKCRVISRAKTTLGLPGVLAGRLQPNHPADSIEGITASICEGLSYGVGDAVIGINPVFDTAETVARLLQASDEIIRKLELPTQNCILSHISTQMKAIEDGAPAGLIFQSIAGSQKANTAFGINLEFLMKAD